MLEGGARGGGLATKERGCESSRVRVCAAEFPDQLYSHMYGCVEQHPPPSPPPRYPRRRAPRPCGCTSWPSSGDRPPRPTHRPPPPSAPAPVPFPSSFHAPTPSPPGGLRTYIPLVTSVSTPRRTHRLQRSVRPSTGTNGVGINHHDVLFSSTATPPPSLSFLVLLTTFEFSMM